MSLACTTRSRSDQLQDSLPSAPLGGRAAVGGTRARDPWHQTASGRTISNGCSSAGRSRTRDDFVVDLEKATAEILSFQNRARKPADHSPHWEDLVSFWKSLGTTVDTAEVKHVRHFRHFLTHRRGRFAQGEPDEVLGALADVAGRAMGHDLSHRAAYPY